MPPPSDRDALVGCTIQMFNVFSLYSSHSELFYVTNRWLQIFLQPLRSNFCMKSRIEDYSTATRSHQDTVPDATQCLVIATECFLERFHLMEMHEDLVAEDA
jgi:hypothetical protein